MWSTCQHCHMQGMQQPQSLQERVGSQLQTYKHAQNQVGADVQPAQLQATTAASRIDCLTVFVLLL